MGIWREKVRFLEELKVKFRIFRKKIKSGLGGICIFCVFFDL